jgi:tetraacyldisaccharide 4'-kinase
MTKGFIDHQAFSAEDLQQFSSDMPLLMTEKDAVKCADFAQEHYWYLPVDAIFATNNDSAAMATEIANIAALASKPH